MRWARGLLVGVATLVTPGLASAQVVLGYQLGLTQSVGTTLGDNLNTQTLLAQQNQANQGAADPTRPGGAAAPTTPANTQTAGLSVSALQGVQLNTQATANLTLDIVTRTFNHGFVLGMAVGQLVPLAVPESEVQVGGEPVDINAQLRERITTVQATATYLARLQLSTWTLSLGANYAFGLNGRLNNGASGGVGGAGGVGTLPAAPAGAFAFNGITHTAGGLFQLQITKLRWDLVFGTNYSYAQNGIYTLAAGALGGQGQAGAAATNLGAFIPANLHVITPTLVARARLGRRGLLTTDANVSYNVANEIRDGFEVFLDGTTVVTRAPPPPPQTLINNLRLEYGHQFGRERTVGVDVQGTLSFRVTTDAQGVKLPGVGLRADSLIYTARAFWRDTLPWELRVNAAVGAAQATLFQAPLGGAGGDPDAFEPVRSNWEPVGTLTLQRRFNPIDVTLVAARNVGVGALGASAIVAESAAITFQHIAEFGERRLVSNLGFNANRTQGVGQELFEGFAANDPLVAAFNNYGLGATAGFAMPILVSGPFSVDAVLTYNFNWVDTDPNDVTNIAPLATHVGLLTLRAIFGRGTAQGASGAGGQVDTDELDAFSANPATGAPLLTQRLLRQGAPLQTGARPGEPPEARRDSRQAYQQSIRQQAIEQEAREKAGAMLGVGSSIEEEKRALEREKAEQKKREEERSRDFGEWPSESVPLPETPPPEPE